MYIIPRNKFRAETNKIATTKAKQANKQTTKKQKSGSLRKSIRFYFN